MYVRNGKRSEVGLGGGRDLSLATARAEAAKLRETLATGGDPKAERAKDDYIPTFRQVRRCLCGSDSAAMAQRQARGTKDDDTLQICQTHAQPAGERHQEPGHSRSAACGQISGRNCGKQSEHLRIFSHETKRAPQLGIVRVGPAFGVEQESDQILRHRGKHLLLTGRWNYASRKIG